jgi:diguanylate cyclase (GGDEF)-like protein/PAS domain S-box-containing protein
MDGAGARAVDAAARESGPEPEWQEAASGDAECAAETARDAAGSGNDGLLEHVADAVGKAAPSDQLVSRPLIARFSKGRRSNDFAKTRLPGFSSLWMVPESWWAAAPTLLILAVVAGFASTSIPPTVSLASFAAAAAIPVFTRWFTAFERAEGRGQILRIAIYLLGVALPMLLFGFGMGSWAMAGDFDWSRAFASLAIVLVVSSAVLRRRLSALIGAQVAQWVGVALATGIETAGSILAAGMLLAFLVSYQQKQVERRIAEEEQQRKRIETRAEDILHDYEETGQGWFWETDRKGRLTYISPPVARLLGQSSNMLKGQLFIELFNLNSGEQDGERTLTFHLSARSSFQELAMRAAVPGEERWWSVSGRPIFDDFDNFVGFRGSGTDLTERRLSQEKAARLAQYDSLTSLANRHQMSQTLERILGAQHQLKRCCSVMLLDLDRFKQVNDTMGHPAGDALLVQVAQRLQRVVGEMGRVGRLGGDEFQIVIPGEYDRQRLGHIAQDIINSLSQPYSIEGQRVVISASVGVSLAPDDGVTSEALIRNADLALYAAKDGGRGRCHFYANELHARAERRAELEQDLRDALQHGHLELHYQPVVQLATETITGFEALLRWNHPVKGRIPPSAFVEVAEEAGLIGAMGEWALRTACNDLAQWPGRLRMAVNVSPLQFANPEFPAVVTSAIAHAGIQPGQLELEITESVFLNDDPGTHSMFDALKRIGVRLVLDDFGTGYSSLGYLKKAPFDKIKIDQSFVRGAIQPGSRNGAIIASIANLAQSLGMDTTAEGVETHDELDLVRRHGCSHVQGYIYDAPLNFDAATERLQAGAKVEAQGPRSAREPRQKVLRLITLNHNGEHYNGTIRNISETGALIEGLWNVPLGTYFLVNIADDFTIGATARWSQEDCLGVEFDERLKRDDSGRFLAFQGLSPKPVPMGPVQRVS